MEDTSKVSYWIGDNIVCSIPSIKVPNVGEELYIDTLSDEHWFDVRFKDKKLFDPGYRGKYCVISVVRSIQSYDIVATHTTEKGTYEFPSKSYEETFDVHLAEI